jgi:hypothetical protein
MHKDRDMTYGELTGLLEHLMRLGVLLEDDVVMRFIQMQNVDFACPFLYIMRSERVKELIRQSTAGALDEDIEEFTEKSSVKSVVSQIKSKHFGDIDENIGLLDFKDKSKPEQEKFGGYLTAAGLLHHKMQQAGFAGNIDGPEETDTAVFGFRIFNGKWIPVIAKLPSDSDGVRTIKIPPEVADKLSAYTKQLKVGELMRMDMSSMDPDVLEFLEITRNPHLYDEDGKHLS